MASEVKTDKLSPSTGTALQIGDASDTITIPTGATFTITDGLGVAGGGTGLTSFTAGDVLYATGTTTLAKLAKGTAEQVLAMNTGATAPDWGSVDLTVLPTITVAKGGTNLTSFTAGDILYATGATTLAKLAKGAAAEVLAMNTGATAPEWVTAGGGTTVKRHYFEFATRTAGGSGATTDQFTFTTSFVPTDPTVNDLYVETIIPTWSPQNGGVGVGLSFLDGSANRDSYFNEGIMFVYVGGSYQAVIGQSFNIPAGDLAAGTFTITWRSNTANSQPSFYCPTSTDDSRIVPNSIATLMITEYKN